MSEKKGDNPDTCETTKKAQGVIILGPITDPDRLFNDIAVDISSKIFEIGIDLGLKLNDLTNELESGKFMGQPESRKAIRMLQLWQQSVVEYDFTYSVLAAALEKRGFRACAHKYCYIRQ